MEKVTKITFYGKDFSPLADAEYSLAGPEQKLSVDDPHLDLLRYFCTSFKKDKGLFNGYNDYFDRTVGVFREKEFYNPFDQKYYDVTLEISCRFDEGHEAYFLSAMLLSQDLKDLIDPNEVNITTLHQVMDILLLFMYKKQLAEAAKKGIFRKYQRFENNDSRPHGTIDIARHIRANMGLKNGKIAYHYRELTANNPANRLILAAYGRLCEKFPKFCETRIRNDESVYSTLKMLQTELGYSKASVRNIVKENLRPITHPYFSEYEALRKTCLIILRDEGVSIFDAESAEETESLSTDVTRLWEQFLECRFNKLMKKPEYSGLELKAQEEKPIFAGRKKPTAKPDFVLWNGTEALAILDAKFRPSLKDVISEDTPGDDQTKADINKCIRDMEVFQAPRTGVIFPVKEEESKDLSKDKKYHIGYPIGDHESARVFDMVQVRVPKVRVLKEDKERKESFEVWYRKLEKAVDDALEEYLEQVTAGAAAAPASDGQPPRKEPEYRMEQTLTALRRFLDTRPGFEAVLIAPTLSMGRQLLDACAASSGGVLGVRVHTPDTLALELCGADCPGLLSHDAGASLVLSLLREKGDSWPFFSALGAERVTLSAARALLEDILLLEREEKDLPAGQESPRLAGLSALLAAYREEKDRRGLWDRYDLFARAANRLEEKPITVPLAICANVTGEGVVRDFLTALNAAVLPVPCAWQAPAVPALFLPQTMSAPAARLRFAKCYGAENEALFPFYDLLEHQIPFGQAAILCAGRETLPMLWEQAERLGIPLTLDGGVPLEKGTLLPLLRSLASWYGEDCPVEGLPGLMAGGLAVPQGTAFLKHLRENHVGGGLSRYLERLEPDKHDKWIQFCEEIRRLFAETTSVAEGLAELRPFLQKRYVKRLPQVRVPECAALLSALEGLAGDAPGGSFFSRLPELLDAAAQTPWQSAAPRDGAVHAAPLSKGAFLNRPYTYVLGLGWDALTDQGRESPLLRDEERLALGLPGADSGAELPSYFLGTVLAAGEEVTLSYSCFDTEKAVSLPPSPVYERLREQNEPLFFGYHRAASLTGADRWLEGYESPALAAVPAAGTAGLPEDFVFSASSLELAIQCPRRFYFQYILALPQVEKTDPSQRGWLPANAFGSLVHGTLEDYFDRLIRSGQAPDLDAVWASHLSACQQRWPCADAALRDREARRARDCVVSAVDYFQQAQKGSAPLATELTFGRKTDPGRTQPNPMPEQFTLQLDGELSLPFTGSIDRLDRLPGGAGLAIMDYKTGDMGWFFREFDSKLQYYLYARAVEQLGLGQVTQAVYLFLSADGVRPLICHNPCADAKRLSRVKALVKLLRAGRAADIAQPAWRDSGPVCDDADKERQGRLKACAKYCPYAALCKEKEVCP